MLVQTHLEKVVKRLGAFLPVLPDVLEENLQEYIVSYRDGLAFEGR